MLFGRRGAGSRKELRLVARVSAEEVIEAFASVPRERSSGRDRDETCGLRERGMARLDGRYVRSSQVRCLTSAIHPARPTGHRAPILPRSILLQYACIRVGRYMVLSIRNPEADPSRQAIGRAQ